MKTQRTNQRTKAKQWAADIERAKDTDTSVHTEREREKEKTDAGAGHDLLADVRMSEKMSGKSTISPARALQA